MRKLVHAASLARLAPLALGGAVLAACSTESASDGGDGLAPITQLAPMSGKGGPPAGTRGRYIVGTKGAAARAAVQAAGGSIALDLPAHGAFAAYLPAAALAGLAQNPAIDFIEEDALRHPTGETTPYGVSMVQASAVWDANGDGVVDEGANTGAAKVCIIDSGLDTTHPDFQGMTITGTHDPAGTGSWNLDSCGHGTHVAGTIAAAQNGVGVVGVAPGASLHIVKVFGGDAPTAGCDWAYSSSLVAALDKCRAAGAKIVSMSLGGSLKSRLEDDAFKKAAAAGVLSIAAAGNDGSTRMSYPASYASVVSVAAVDSAMSVADFSQKNSQVELAAPGVAVLSSVPVGTGRAATTTVDGIAIASNGMDGAPLAAASGALVDCGYGDAPCAAAGGKICLIERGNNVTFEAKVTSCAAGGGAGAILFNNVAGSLGGSVGTSTAIPSVGISQADGLALRAGSLGKTASVALSATDHSAWNGTSMATPHVSGVAALVWAAHPDWSAATVRTALGATALDLGTAGRDTSYGFGLVRAQAAIAYTPSTGGGGGGGTCKAAGASCASGAECCSTRCAKKTGLCQ